MAQRGRGQRRHERGGGRQHDRREPDGGAHAAARGDHDGDHGQRRPGGVLHRACHSQDESGRDGVPTAGADRERAPAPGEQRQRQAREGDHRRVGDSHRQRERHDRARQPERGIPQGVPVVASTVVASTVVASTAGPVTTGPALPRRQRDPERRVQQQERPGDQPGPRLARQAERAGQAEQRHDRQVGVISEPAAGGQRGGRQVGTAVVHEQGPGPGHHRDIRGSGLPGHEPEGRRGQRPRQADRDREPPAPGVPRGRDRDHGGDGVPARRPGSPPVIKPGPAEQGDPGGIHREPRVPTGPATPAAQRPDSSSHAVEDAGNRAAKRWGKTPS
jgi:hypothetical protein